MEEFELYFENFKRVGPSILGSLLLAFVITYFAIPSVVTVAKAKMLYDIPNNRASHNHSIPILGGMTVFAGLLISTIVFSSMIEFGLELNCLIGGLIILFFIGIKDDILILDPRKKIIAQVLAALLVIILGDIRITHFHGFFGINEINYATSLICTTFFFIVIINGFNLIDGIDGLASAVGILVSTAFGCWFVGSNHNSYAIMSFALIGSLTAFFYFNVFGKQNKIFLGDTGSLILGFTIAVFAIKFMEYEINATGILVVRSTPAVTFGLLIVPLFDTIRVFFIRLYQKRSPFKADKQHIHHRLLELGFSHIQATVTIICFNLLFFGLTITLQRIGNLYLIILQLTLAVTLSYIMMRQVRKNKKDRFLYHRNKKYFDPSDNNRISPVNYPLKNISYTQSKNSDKHTTKKRNVNPNLMQKETHTD